MTAFASSHPAPMTAPGRIGRPRPFWLGVLLITLGVSLHGGAFLATRAMGAQPGGMADMATQTALVQAAMLLDLLGLALSGWALLPRGWRRGQADTTAVAPAVATADLPAQVLDGPRITPGQGLLVARLLAGLILDTMKPATIGFMLPGLRAEYGLQPAEVALLPLVALAGTTLGSVLFGLMGDVAGRRLSLIATSLIIAATSICGLMPAFAWQLAMCFIMGLAAGGELPLIYAVLAEMMPARHRGWLTVLVAGLGGLGGLLAASTLALLLEPAFSWRVLWLPNLPTALAMLLLLKWVPESPRFLLLRARVPRAPVAGDADPSRPVVAPRAGVRALLGPGLRGRTVTLCVYGIAWGLLNWGVLTWLPTILRGLGQDAAVANRLLATSALFALPGTLVAAALYGLWSSRRTAVLFALATCASLVLFGLALPVLVARSELVTLLVVALLVASSGMVGVLSPYSVELYPTALRSAGGGLVAASTKVGGVVGPSLVGALLAASANVALPALVIAVPLGLAGGLMWWKGVETRGRTLEDLADAATRPARRLGAQARRPAFAPAEP